MDIRGGVVNIATLYSVVNKWEFLPSKKRNLRMARELAKSVIHKVSGVCGKKYLKSMGEARFLYTMMKNKKDFFNTIKYEQDTWAYQPKPRKYFPDFRIKVGESYHWIEYKGRMDGQIRTKLKDIKRCNPDKSLILVFERGKNKLSSKSKVTYLAWAKQYGFPAFDTQDSNWVKDLKNYLIDNSKLIKGVK